jgi:hypothetical protein
MAQILRNAVLTKKSVPVVAVDVTGDDGYFWAMMSVLLSLLLTLRTWARSRVALQLEVLALQHQLNEAREHFFPVPIHPAGTRWCRSRRPGSPSSTPAATPAIVQPHEGDPTALRGFLSGCELSLSGSLRSPCWACCYTRTTQLPVQRQSLESTDRSRLV